MGGPLKATLDSLTEGFRRETGIEVSAVNMGNYTALSQKLMAAAMAGNLPELSQSYEAWTSQLLEKGALASFGDFASAPGGFDSSDLSDFFPVMLAECSRNGRLVTLPFNKSVPVYYYNRDLFQKAGLDPDRFPETWEAFVAAAKTILGARPFPSIRSGCSNACFCRTTPMFSTARAGPYSTAHRGWRRCN